jgi:hypothetical protein
MKTTNDLICGKPGRIRGTTAPFGDDMEYGMLKWKRLPRAKTALHILPGILAILCIFVANARAMDDSDRIRELERKLEEQGKTINDLTDKVKELDDRAAERKPDEPREPPAAGTGIRSILDDITFLHGFADAGFGFGSKRGEPAERPRGFAVGSFDLYLTPRVGDRVRSLIELLFEFNEDGNLEVDLERLQVGYTFSDKATVWLGRFQTPLGYWNTAYHHGAQIQTSILRPRFIDFEDKGGILPVNSVGVWGTGKTGLARGKLTYDLYVVNGPKIKDVVNGSGGELDPNNFRDDNNDFSVGANVGYEFGESLDGLKLGTHWLRAVVDGYDPGGTRLQGSELNVVGGYLLYANYNWETIAEFYQFLDKDRSAGSGTHSSQAGFVQLGYTIAQFTPYARFEVSKLDQGDNYFSQQKNGRSYSREVLGIRYDLSPKSALKLEGNHTSMTDRGSESFDEIRAQFAIRF